MSALVSKGLRFFLVAALEPLRLWLSLLRHRRLRTRRVTPLSRTLWSLCHGMVYRFPLLGGAG